MDILNYVIFAAGGYLLGFISGFVVRSFVSFKGAQAATGNNFVLFIVTSIWGVSMFVDFTNPAYTTSPLVHGLMGAIVGFFYKPPFLKKD